MVKQLTLVSHSLRLCSWTHLYWFSISCLLLIVEHFACLSNPLTEDIFLRLFILEDTDGCVGAALL